MTHLEDSFESADAFGQTLICLAASALVRGDQALTESLVRVSAIQASSGEHVEPDFDRLCALTLRADRQERIMWGQAILAVVEAGDRRRLEALEAALTLRVMQ